MRVPRPVLVRLVCALSLASTAACNDIEIRQIPNEAPIVEIVNQRDGDVVLEGYTVHFIGSATDDRGVVSCTWYVDDAEVCTGVPNEDAECPCDWTVPLTDGVRVRFEAVDEELLKDSQLLDLVVQATEPPEVTITKPVSTSRYYDNVPVPLTGIASDAEDEETALLVTWADAAGALADAGTTPDARGVFESEHLFEQGHHSLTVTVTDQSGKTGTAAVEIDVGGPNTAPTCELTFPVDGSELAEFRETIFAGTVDDVDVPADQLTVTFTDDVDGEMGMAVPSVDGDVQFPWTDLSRGRHVVTMTVIDDAGARCTDTVTVEVVEPPSAPVVHIEPENPGGGDDLTCYIDSPSVDPQGDPVSYVFRWYYDGVELAAGTTETVLPGDTVPFVYTAPAQLWECRASGTDGRTEGTPGTDTVTIGIPSVDRIYPGTNHTCQIDTATQLNCFGDGSLNRNDLSDGNYVSVGLGHAHTCGVDIYGGVQCAGNDVDGQVGGAPPGSNWRQIDAGDAHTCAVNATGAITCWGDDTAGQSTTSGLTGRYTQVSSAFRHNCAVRTDAGLDCWGEDAFNRLTPTPGVQWSEISAGKYHNCGLDTAGLAHCFGRNAVGEANPPGGTFDHVSAGEQVSCGVRGDGVVECWGAGTSPGGPMDPPPGLYTWVEVGQGHVCAVTTAGDAVCWGDDTFGECDPPATWW